VRRLLFGLLLIGLMVGPFVVQLNQWASSLDTPRVNQQRLAIASDVATRFGETVEWSFVADGDGLERLEIYARTPALTWPTDKSWIEIEDISGETVFAETVSHRSLWDDVFTLTFEPQMDSAGKTYRVRLRPDIDNHSPLILAQDANDDWIQQPYYATDISFGLGLFIVVIERLQWRLVPLGLFILVLGIFVTKRGIPLRVSPRVG
jgi:hypothetical protein